MLMNTANPLRLSFHRADGNVLKIAIRGNVPYFHERMKKGFGESRDMFVSSSHCIRSYYALCSMRAHVSGCECVSYVVYV